MDVDLKGQHSAIGEIGDDTILWIPLLDFSVSLSLLIYFTISISLLSSDQAIRQTMCPTSREENLHFEVFFIWNTVQFKFDKNNHSNFTEGVVEASNQLQSRSSGSTNSN